MRNYLVRELLNEMNEDRLSRLDSETITLLEKIDLYTTIIDKKYENRLRDKALTDSIEKFNNEIKNLIDKINVVEMSSIKNKNEKLMFQCESRKADLLNIMIYLQEKYL